MVKKHKEVGIWLAQSEKHATLDLGVGEFKHRDYVNKLKTRERMRRKQKLVTCRGYRVKRRSHFQYQPSNHLLVTLE